MSIDWPTAIVAVALIFGAAVVYGTIVAARAAKDDAVIKGKYAEQYEALAAETRDAQSALRTDLAAVRASVEAIEQMMRDVG